MNEIVYLLESMGRNCEADAARNEAVLAGLPADMQRAFGTGDPVALATALGTSPYQACYVTAPENEPVPAETPADLPEDPEQHESQAA
jgi:hypothetical protein